MESGNQKVVLEQLDVPVQPAAPPKKPPTKLNFFSTVYKNKLKMYHRPTCTMCKHSRIKHRKKLCDFELIKDFLNMIQEHKS